MRRNKTKPKKEREGGREEGGRERENTNGML